MKYYIIAGEASGDLHGSNLIRNLRKEDPQADIRAWGGDLMQQAGADVVKHYKELAFMGFIEVVMNLRTIVKNMNFCKKDISDFRPDVLILIDYPGFNLRIAEFAHQQHLKVFYYISPQIWAWKQSRIHQIKRVVDRMFVILPFEKEFYAKFEMDVSFPGHPLIDAIQDFEKVKTGNESVIATPRKRIALIPGSRQQEISTMLPEMIQVMKHFPGYTGIVAVAPSISLDFYRRILGDAQIELHLEGTYSLLMTVDAALVTSGTATLETALFNVPEIVCYKGSRISYWLAKRLIKVKYISLVNLILDRIAVPEMIQHEMRADLVAKKLQEILNDSPFKVKMLEDYKELKTVLGGGGASARTAHEMVARLRNELKHV